MREVNKKFYKNLIDHNRTINDLFGLTGLIKIHNNKTIEYINNSLSDLVVSDRQCMSGVSLKAGKTVKFSLK